MVVNRRAAAFTVGENLDATQVSNITESGTQFLTDQASGGNESAKQPWYFSGARAFVRIAGRATGISQSIRWTASYQATPLNTIDTAHAWDIDVGQCQIMAELSAVVDPTKGPEHNALFTIMSAAQHQPLVEIQVLDRKTGSQVFFARGIFTEVSGGVGIRDLASWTCRFIGMAYQHNTNQQFQPYGSIQTGPADDTLTALDSAVAGTNNIAEEGAGSLFNNPFSTGLPF